MTDRETEILNKLLMNEERALESLEKLVEMASQLFIIDPKARTVVLTEKAKSGLSDKDKVSVYLIALYFGANKLKFEGKPVFKSESASATEVAVFLGKKITAISGRLTELTRDGMIEKDPEGDYRVRYYKIEEIMATLVRKTDWSDESESLKPKPNVEKTHGHRVER